MATVVWNPTDGTLWATAANWEGGAAAVNGDTIDIAVATTPTSIPDQAGETYHFNITHGVTATLSNWINGGAIGNVTAASATAAVTIGAAATGNVATSEAGATISTSGGIAGTLAIVAGSSITFTGSAGMNNVVGNVTLGGVIANSMTGGGLMFSGDVACATNSAFGLGTRPVVIIGTLSGNTTLSSTGAATLTTGICNLDAAAEWSLTSNSTLTINNTGIVSLGQAAAKLAVNLNGSGKTFTLSGDETSHGLTLTLGQITGGGYTWTVQGGGLTKAGGTLDAAGTLNVHVTDNCNVTWDDSTHLLGNFTIMLGRTATMTSDIYCQSHALALPGNMGSMAGAFTLYVIPTAPDFWCHAIGTYAITLVSIDTSNLAAATNADAINVGSQSLSFDIQRDGTLTSGSVTGGTMIVRGKGGTNTTGTLVVNGNLTYTTLALGVSDDATLCGAVTLATTGRHAFGGPLARAGAGAGSNNAVIFGGVATMFGNITLAGIITDFGSTYLDGAVTIDGTDATSVANTNAVISRATVQNLLAPAANPICIYDPDERSYQINNPLFPATVSPEYAGVIGSGNQNVRFGSISGIGPASGSSMRRRGGRLTHTSHGRGRFNR